MEEKPSKIILLSDVIETKLRKEKELKYYEEELKNLQEKMFFLRKEIDLTELIITIIDKEMLQEIGDSKTALLYHLNETKNE